MYHILVCDRGTRAARRPRNSRAAPHTTPPIKHKCGAARHPPRDFLNGFDVPMDGGRFQRPTATDSKTSGPGGGT